MNLPNSSEKSWLRCYRCWSKQLEIQIHYEGVFGINAIDGSRGEAVEELQEAAVQCLSCMHDQPHLHFQNGAVVPDETRWERLISGTPWVASCSVTVDEDSVDDCSGPGASDALAYSAFGSMGTKEFFTHVRFHTHSEGKITVHLLVELYARSPDEATEVLSRATKGSLVITSLAEESRPPAATSASDHN